MTRSANKKIIVLSNSLAGKVVDLASQEDQRALVYDRLTDTYIHVDVLLPEAITFEALLANNDVGSGSDQVAAGDHDHDVGDLLVLFENRIV